MSETAERRMFAKTIVLSDAFLDMSLGARCLYMTFGMVADDDGFVNNPRSIMRQCGASDDDMKILIAKKFVLVFEDGVLVIKHWRINNYLRSDRYQETKYTEHKDELTVEENGAYTRTNDAKSLPLTSVETRKKAYSESELPYSFTYKMRNAFSGRNCPICGRKMLNYEGSRNKPTIQHNVPISRGGKHELSNISIVCLSCNTSIRDKETGDLNNKEVREVWEEICKADKEAIGIPSNGIPSIGKNSIGKDSIGNKSSRFAPPSLEEVQAYITEKGYSVNAESFINFYESKGWMIGKNKMKDWKAAVRTWQSKEKGEEKKFSTETDTDYDALAQASMERLYKEYG